MEHLLELCRSKLMADGLKKGEDWQGYEVYLPVYKKPLDIGHPKLVLVKNSVIKISTTKEYFDYQTYLKSKKN